MKFEADEIFYQRLLDQISDLAFVISPNYEVIFVNNACSELLHRPKTQIIGQKIYQIFPPHIAESFIEGIRTVCMSNQKQEREELLEHGSIKMWINTQLYPIRDDQDHLIGTLGISRDFTNEYQFRADLKRRIDIEKTTARILQQFISQPYNQINQILENGMAQLAQLLEADRSYIYLLSEDQQSLRLTHCWHSDKVSPFNFAKKILPVEHLQSSITHLKTHPYLHANHLTDISVANVSEKDFFTSAGVQSLMILPLKDEGVFRGIWGVDSLHADKKWAPEDLHILELISNLFMGAINWEKLRLHQKEAENQISHSAKLATIGNLAAGVAHEINNPLAIIKGLIEIHRDKLLKPKQLNAKELRELLEKKECALERIASIVSSLRTYARADNSIIESIDAHKVINDTLSICESIYRSRNIIIQKDLNAAHFNIKANIGKLQQVLMNLLSNARDAIESVTASGKIQVSTFQKDTELVIQIIDNGCGIPEEILNRIFDPFYPTKSIEYGTIIGLAISQSIMNSFGGTIEVDSEPGIGTTVSLRLPLTDEAAKPVFETRRIEVKLTGKILLVEEDIHIRDILCQTLKEAGLDIIEAKDGQEALVLLSEHKDLKALITDLKMSKFSGYQMLLEAEAKALLQIPTIIITGGFITDYSLEERQALRRIARGYLKKPFNKNQLLQVVEKVLKS